MQGRRDVRAGSMGLAAACPRPLRPRSARRRAGRGGARAVCSPRQPAQGAVGPEAPARVTFTFDEPVRSGGHATLSGGKLAGEVGALRAARSRRTAARRAAACRGSPTATTSSPGASSPTTATARRARSRSASASNTPRRRRSSDQKTQRDTGLAVARWIFLAGLLAAAGIAAVGSRSGAASRVSPRGALAAVARRRRRGRAARAVAASGRARHPLRAGDLPSPQGSPPRAALAALASLRLRPALRAAEAAAIGLVVAPALAGHALALRPPGVARVPRRPRPHRRRRGLDRRRRLARAARGPRPRSGGAAARFTRVALVAIAVLGLSGVARAAAELTSVDEVCGRRATAGCSSARPCCSPSSSPPAGAPRGSRAARRRRRARPIPSLARRRDRPARRTGRGGRRRSAR